jgi:SAM-dependent methyltransferase
MRMSKPDFKDHFSGHAGQYTRYRPGYPQDLFRSLAALAPDLECAWDCATGNGQAALGLAAHFSRVEATDASAKQIAEAVAHPRMRYSVAAAEASGLPDASVSLVCVAQAMHWFDLERFYAEARRVAKPEAVLAACTYESCRVSPVVDRITGGLYADVLGAYWPPERRHVELGYKDLPFPFTEIQLPAFHMQADWTLEHYRGDLRTWSAVQAYIRKNGKDPLQAIEADLAEAWGGAAAVHSVRWPLNLRVGWID